MIFGGVSYIKGFLTLCVVVLLISVVFIPTINARIIKIGDNEENKVISSLNTNFKDIGQNSFNLTKLLEFILLILYIIDSIMFFLEENNPILAKILSPFLFAVSYILFSICCIVYIINVWIIDLINSIIHPSDNIFQTRLYSSDLGGVNA